MLGYPFVRHHVELYFQEMRDFMQRQHAERAAEQAAVAGTAQDPQPLEAMLEPQAVALQARRCACARPVCCDQGSARCWRSLPARAACI